jgi:hypothetical protein
LRTALRFLSLILIVTGIVLLGADVLTSLDQGGAITVRSTEEVWTILNAGSLVAFKAWVQHSAPWASGAAQAMLNVWGWALTGIPGVVLAFVPGRPEIARQQRN